MSQMYQPIILTITFKKKIILTIILAKINDWEKKNQNKWMIKKINEWEN